MDTDANSAVYEDIIKLSVSGRITIPKKIRDALDLRNGTTLQIFKDGEYIILKKTGNGSILDIINYTKSLASNLRKEISKKV